MAGAFKRAQSIDDGRAGQELREDVRSEVEGVKRELVSALVAELMGPVEGANDVGRGAAAGQEQCAARRRSGASGFEKSRQAVGQLRPIKQAAADT